MKKIITPDLKELKQKIIKEITPENPLHSLDGKDIPPEDFPKLFGIQSMDEKYMKEALKLAKRAASLGEVPVGAVIVKDDKIIARGYNRRETDQDGLAHAELIAIKKACKKVGFWRLEDCTLYVTLEPCPMCTGAIINTRIPRVVFGASDPKGGAMGGLCDLPSLPWNHHPEIQKGVLEEECSQVLKDFFKELREKKKKEKS